MISRRSLGFVALALVAGASAASAAPPVATEIAIQGVARDASDFVIPSGNLAVRVYADSLGTTPLYDSGSTFTGAIQQGLFDVIVGRATPLLLDPEQSYFLEMDVAGVEVIGDAAGGRQQFQPLLGSRARPDLEARLTALEAAMGLGLVARGGGDARMQHAALASPPRLTSAFTNVHGMLGPARASGVNGSYRVTADLLAQPVGIRGSGAVQAWLCPRFLSLPTPDPAIRSARDVPGDQGRSLRLKWRNDWRERADDPSDPLPKITGYTVYRRVDAGQSALAAAARPSSPELQGLPPGTWDVLTTIPATLDSTYQTVVPTLCDSTDQGLCFSVFFVRALTDRVGLYHDSPADSGWSVDNLAPGVPAGFALQVVSGGTQLSWQSSTAPDFQYFRVYRGGDPQFTPSPATLVHATATSGWLDPQVGPYTWKLTAVDANGNESPPAQATATTAVEEVAPRTLAFASLAPNPFTGRLRLAIEVPERAGHVTLAVFDVSGRRLRSLVDGALAAGRYAFAWDGRSDEGGRVAPGVYVARLSGAGRTFTRRVTFLP